MSRSGYSYDYDQWSIIRWRGAVASAIRGKRGQAFLREMLAALDAMPEKKLIYGEIEAADGGVCALGCVGRVRHMDMAGLDPEDRETVAAAFGIPLALASEIVFENDEDDGYRTPDTPEGRFERMRRWVASNIKLATPE